jgi:hypothetical protein
VLVPAAAASAAGSIEDRGAALGIKYYLFCWSDHTAC